MSFLEEPASAYSLDVLESHRIRKLKANINIQKTSYLNINYYSGQVIKKKILSYAV